MDGTWLIVTTVAVVLAVTALLSWYQLRVKARSWSGTVSKIGRKTIDRSRGEETPQYETYVHIVVQSDHGKRIKLSYREDQFEKLFPRLSVGERLVKEAGQWLPRRESAEQATG